MARSPKPKDAQADSVLDGAGPVADVAALPEPVAEVAALPEPVAEVAALPEPVAEVAALPEPVAEVAAQASADPDIHPRPGPVVRVRAMQPQRWRIGRAFGVEPVDIPAADLTGAEAAALMADPLLSVTLIEPD